MLLRFTVDNFLSFKNKSVIDFYAGSIKEYKDNVYHLPSSNAGILKSIGIFGHNASGKTNLIKGLSFMRDLVVSSSREVTNSRKIPLEPFLLAAETENQSSTFEITILLNDIRYRYGFTVNSKFIESEWLFATEKRKEDNLFVRAKQNFSFEKKFKSTLRGKFELVSEMTKSNTLFLSVLAQFNYQLCLDISNWFSKLIIAHDTDHTDLIDFTAKLMTVGEYHQLLNNVIKNSEIGINTVEGKLRETAERTNIAYDLLATIFADDTSQYSIRTGHTKYKDNKPISSVFFDLMKNESLGTQKFFGILGPLLYTIKERGIICIDEIDARMHSHLLNDIVGLFNSNKTNPGGAQLIFTSHNTNILKKGLRRDQIFFTEKDMYGVSTISNLHSKAPQIRKDASFDKDYLAGKYGAVPGLGEGSQLNMFDAL